MADTTVKSPAAQARYSLRELLGYFLYLGAVGFGGPVAAVLALAVMSRWKVPEPLLGLAAAVAGLLIRTLVAAH